MRRIVIWSVGLAVAATGWVAPVSEASEAPEISMTLAPVTYIAVDGDSGRFREHHWTKEGYSGGISEFSAHHGFDNGMQFHTAGHALVDQNDFGTELELKKDGLGFVELDFKEFRKYFDGNAGVYHLFSTLSTPDTDKDLRLDIGKLELATGLTLEGMPELTFGYEREYKDGTKTKLSWGEAEQAVSGTDTTRNIVPTWMEVDEIVDAFTLGAADELAGFALSGEQRWEFVRSEAVRQELDVSTTGGSGDDKIRRHEMGPESTLMTTLLGAERGFHDDKMFVSTAYRFAHMDNREFETIIESNAAGVATNFSNAEQKRDARSDVDYDTHTWVANSSFQLAESLSVITKLKTELIKEEGNSAYPSDDDSGAVPDNVINHTEVSLSDMKAVRWGEGLAFRFTGIPRTALYTELELEQARVLVREDRKSLDGPDTLDNSVSGENFARETVTDVRRGVWTLGTNVAPWSVLNLTAQVRRRINNQDSDDQRETSGSIRSAFFDGMSVHTKEFVTRATYRPARWLRSSIRYQYRDDDYSTWVQAQARTKSDVTSHIYTYDVTLQPVNDLILMGSFSRQAAVTTTPARYGSGSTNTPAFHADVNTWLFSGDYTVTPRLVVTGSLQHTRARNFNDFTVNGLPLGADFDKVDLTTGLTWSWAEDASLGAEYGFYHYLPNSNWGAGDYDAHLISLEVSKTF